MKRLCKSLIMLCYSIAMAWLAWAVIEGTAGIVTGLAILILVIVFMIKDEVAEKDISSPLLLNLICILSNLVCIRYPEVLPLTISVGAAGILGITYWIYTKKYAGKTLLEILDEELRFPPLLDVLGILIIAGNAIKEKDLGNPVVWIIIALLLADLVRQQVFRRGGKNKLYA